MADRVSWAAELRTMIDSIGVDYDQLRRAAETGVDDDGELQDTVVARAAATAAATQALVRIVLALDDLPELKGSFREGPLVDLIAALDDLRRGQSPDFFRPWPNSKGQLSAKIDMLKMRAVTSVMVVERSDASNAEARRIVAKIFADAGHVGKKGAPVSASTLFQWCTELAPALAERREHQIIATALAQVPERVTRAQAIRLVKNEAVKRL